MADDVSIGEESPPRMIVEVPPGATLPLG